MTSAQLSEWEAYDRLDPIGAWREDLRGAQLQSLLVNIVSKLYGKDAKMTVPLDFMPDWEGKRSKEPKRQSVEEMKQVLLSIAAAQNKRVRENEILNKRTRKDKLKKP